MFRLFLYIWESHKLIPRKNEIALLATFWRKGAFTTNINTSYPYLLDKHALTSNMQLQGRETKDIPFL